MRAFYTAPDGRSADLCLYLNRKTTRLTVHDPSVGDILRQDYPSWDAAIDALRNIGSGWINDLTHQPLT